MRIRRFNLSIIKIFIATAVCIFLFLPKGYTAEEKGYAPGEIIVKFKAEAADSLEREILQKEKPADSIRLNSSLDRLNKKYGVKEFKQIFRNFKENREKLENLRLKNEVKIKYSLNQILFTEKERHLLKRLKRAPKDAKIPDLDRIYKLELEEGRSVEEAVAEYSKDPNIEYAQPNYIYKLYATPLPPEPYIPNDYYIEDGQNPGYWREGSWEQDYPDLWGLEKIQAIEAWNFFDTDGNGVIDGDESLPGEGAIVAVIDTGVDYNHEDLHANIWQNDDEIPDNGLDDDENGYVDDFRGWDISDGDNDPIDYHGHGTHCSGTIAAMGDNTVGIAGVAYGAKIMPVKVFPKATSENCAKGIRYAAFNGADVLSNSWGPDPSYGPHPSDPTEEAAIDDAYAIGCIVVFAAGNSNDDVANYSPANYPKTIAVAATDYEDNKAIFSCWGDEIDVAAPGVDVLSLRANGTDMYGDGAHIVDDYYYRSSGTSMACPHVAGLAALLLSYEVPLGNEEIRELIRSSADDLGETGFDIYYGQGRINACNAIFKAMLEFVSPKGRIFLDKDYYSAPSEAVITVLDTDLNANPELHDTVTVELKSSTETIAESVILTEIEADKGIFRGGILIEAGASPLTGDGKLTVRHNDIITATYLEGDPPGAREATAVADLQPPIIDSVEAASEITLSGEPVTTITWHTDEPSSSFVYYGTTTSLGPEVAIYNYTTEHVVEIRDLEINTLYYFAVKSKDILGNTAYDDNGGTFYQFTIIPPAIDVMPLNFSFETLEGATTPIIDTFTVSNITGSESVDLLFEISWSSADWLSVSPDIGRISSGSSSMDIQVSVDPARLRAGDYLGEVVIYNNTPSGNPTIVPVEVNALPAPAVHYKKYHIIDDWSLEGSFRMNGDRQFNPGERIELQIEVKNFGSLPATGVSATLSLATDDRYITILDDMVDFGDAPAGASILSLDNFLIESRKDTPDHHKITFALEITDSEGHQWDAEFQVYVTTFAGSDIRLDTDAPGAAASCGAQIACDNNGNVYVAWEDFRGGERNIYFNHSRDFGATWLESDIRLNNEPSEPVSSWYVAPQPPQITCDDNGNVYVVWEDFRDERRDIYLNYSHDYGATWQASDIRLNTNTAEAISSLLWIRIPITPQIACDNNGNVYVVWQDNRNGKYDIYFNYSCDYGATWQAEDIRLDTDEPGAANSEFPQITCDNSGNVYVVWQDNRNGVWDDIYYNYSSDYGATWQTEDIRLDTDESGAASSEYPQISCDNNGNVYVVWEDGRNGLYDIYFNYSSDFGATWQDSDIRLNRGGVSTWKPQITSDDSGHVYVVWRDYRGMAHDIYFNYSSDYGATWQVKDIQLDEKATHSENPQISCDNNGKVYVVWQKEISLPDFLSYFHIYFNYSTDYGATWQGSGMRVNSSPSATAYFGENFFWENPQVSCDNKGNIYVAWQDSRNGNWDIYFIPITIPDELPMLNLITDQRTVEGAMLEFTVTAANSEGTPLELFFDIQELPQDLQNNLSNATFTTSFNDLTGETNGTFGWIPGLYSAGTYEPVVFVARDPSTGRWAYRRIAIVVNIPVHYQGFYIIDDWSGESFGVNGDKQFNPGERIELEVEVRNEGGFEVRDVSALLYLAEDDPYITILENKAIFPDIPAYSSVLSSENFLIKASGTTPDIHIVNFILDITDSYGRLKQKTFQMKVLSPRAMPETEFRLDTDTAGSMDSKNPQISSDDIGNIYAVWDDARYDVYFNYSHDYGVTWQENAARINRDRPLRSTSEYPRISSDNKGNVYVTWEDWRTGGAGIYFNCSHDYGATWQESDIRLEDSYLENVWKPQITCDDKGHVYVVWQDERSSSSNDDIYLNYSSDFGATWQEENIRIDTDVAGTANSQFSQITCDNSGNIYVAWEDNRNGKDDIYFNYSHDFGATWQENDIRLDTDESGAAYSWGPQISCDNSGHVYVVWEDSRSGLNDIYFNYSLDSGATWQKSDILLNTDGGWAWSMHSQISCDDKGRVYVVWLDARNGEFPDGDIYLNYSSDFGATWQASDIRLTTDEPAGTAISQLPQISCGNDGGVYVVWSDYRNGLSDIYFNYSTDYGATWQGSDIRLDTDEPGIAKSLPSQITCDNNGRAYALWRDDRNGKDDIYFMPIAFAYVFNEVKPGESIQDAITAALPGDIIYINEGEYEEDIYAAGKDVNIAGQNLLKTIVKGNISFSDSDSSIQNLSVLYKHGEGIAYSNGHYTDFNILNNAGITAVNSEVTVKNCVVMPDPLTFGEEKYGKGIQIWTLYGDPDIAPLIENNLILNCEVGVYLYSHASGGAILGNIKNNTFDLNKYGILLRMHKENPLIERNIMTRSLNAIHFTYDDLLSLRWNNIKDNFFGSEEFDNTYDLWMEQRQSGHRYALICPPFPPAPPDVRGGSFECYYWNGNMDGDPEFIQPYEYPDYVLPEDLDYNPQNPDCSDKGRGIF